MIKITCPLTYIPLRREPGHRSEQVSQILFGETAVVSEEFKDWYKVITDFDSYTGWLEKDSVRIPDAVEENQKRQLIKEPFICLRSDAERFILCAGSEIQPPKEDGSVSINHQRFIPETPFKTHTKTLIEDAISFLHAPYLWGGRTLFGIDCSGFIQTLFKIRNINLPRDARDQALIGENVESLHAVNSGDLVFFSQESDSITHVGLYLGNGKIIHASKQVRIDRLDEKGIYNSALKKHTHQFECIKRIPS